MSDNRTESAIQRIEAALARIADIADASAPEPSPSPEPAVSALVEKHETLHETVNSTLEELDKLIAELDR